MSFIRMGLRHYEAVSGVFFAYIGFDAVSVMAEESKNPQRDLPRSMILSLVICTVVYILLALVLTGVLNYRQFEGVGDPLARIFRGNTCRLDAVFNIYYSSGGYDERTAGFPNGTTAYLDEYEPRWADASSISKNSSQISNAILFHDCYRNTGCCSYLTYG